MDHYLEIELLPDPEFVPSVLMNALFGKLHRALVELSTNRIGVSFPGVHHDPPALGARMRLHGDLGNLQRLMELNWLIGMRDHTSLSPSAPVPANTGHRVVRRVQAKSSPARLRRRLARRKGISDEEACNAIPDRAPERLKLPYVTIRSRSTQQTFRLFIDHQPPVREAISGDFGCYGLSSTATVPWF